jgi:hypothetical protein
VADSASFVIRAVYAGTTIDKTYSVVKSKSTFNGPRGLVNIAGAIAGSVWSDASAVLVISNSGYGVPQTKDIVTLYNTSTSYSESKFYDGAAWLSLDAYINGNLLVTGTVVADKIAANSITASKMVAGTITASSAIIADAAITDAKIGGNIQSTNYVANTLGWLLDRTGNLYANNGVFKGSITGATGTFGGDLSAGRISIGTASTATSFFDPTNLNISLNSSASGVLTFNGYVGAAVLTSNDLLFKSNDATWPQAQRVRSGLVFFSMIATAVVDDQLSVWYRINGGTWVWMNGVSEPSGGDGPAAAGFGITISVSLGDTIQMGMSPTDANFQSFDMNKLYLKKSQMTVIGRNF